MELINSVNRCQIAELQKAGKELDPTAYDSCAVFSQHVRNVQAAVTHTYQLTAFAAIRRADPVEAATLWKEMVQFCEMALGALKGLKAIYAHCGTHELYDLALDYRMEAEKRYLQNLQDSECSNIPVPEGLFPKMS